METLQRFKKAKINTMKLFPFEYSRLHDIRVILVAPEKIKTVLNHFTLRSLQVRLRLQLIVADKAELRIFSNQYRQLMTHVIHARPIDIGAHVFFNIISTSFDVSEYL